MISEGPSDTEIENIEHFILNCNQISINYCFKYFYPIKAACILIYIYIDINIADVKNCCKAILSIE